MQNLEGGENPDLAQVKPGLHCQGLRARLLLGARKASSGFKQTPTWKTTEYQQASQYFSSFGKEIELSPLDFLPSLPAASVNLEGRSHQPQQCQEQPSTCWNCFSRAKPLPLRLVHKPPAFSQVAKDSAVKDRRYVHSGLAKWNRQVSEEQLAQELEEKTKKAQLSLRGKCSIVP